MSLLNSWPPRSSVAMNRQPGSVRPHPRLLLCCGASGSSQPNFAMKPGRLLFSALVRLKHFQCNGLSEACHADRRLHVQHRSPRYRSVTDGLPNLRHALVPSGSRKIRIAVVNTGSYTRQAKCRSWNRERHVKADQIPGNSCRDPPGFP